MCGVDIEIKITGASYSILLFYLIDRQFTFIQEVGVFGLGVINLRICIEGRFDVEVIFKALMECEEQEWLVSSCPSLPFRYDIPFRANRQLLHLRKHYKRNVKLRVIS